LSISVCASVIGNLFPIEHDRLVAGAVRRTGQADRAHWSSGSLQLDHPLGD
jgi:hypothetical protein